MPDQTVLTLPFAPADTWAIIVISLILLLSALIFAAMTVVQKTNSPRALDEFSNGQQFLIVMLAIIWLLLFGLTLWGAFEGTWLMLHQQPASAMPQSNGLGGGLGGLGLGTLLAALLGAPFVIWGTWIRWRALGFQKEGHITDRISKAVEQLGAEKTVKVPKPDGSGSDERTVPNIEVRIGGILSLERIAQDSTIYDKGRDHVRVMEILCAYVRENAPAREAKDHGHSEWEPLADDATKEARAKHLARREKRMGDIFRQGLVRTWAGSLAGPRADIAQALQVIGRRNADQRRHEARWGKDAAPDAEWVFDRPCPALPDQPGEAALTEGELGRFRADLDQWRNLIASYRGYRPDLRGTNLQGADLSNAVLSVARMERARMEGAVLKRARMEGAVLSAARMEGADLTAARMEGADLTAARMEGADLRAARMEGADLTAARMEGAVLSAARMEGADLSEARMDSRTSLAKATLRGAFAGDAAWENVTISPDQFKSMFGDASVTLPGGVVPGHADWPAHWPVWQMNRPDFDDQWRKWQADPGGYVPPPPPGA